MASMSDQEPVMVVIGEQDWTKRARCADVLLGKAGRMEEARDWSAGLFTQFPGLSVVALAVPSGLVVCLSDRCRRWSGRLDAIVVVAAAAYLAR
jgi:hypothetical protein